MTKISIFGENFDFCPKSFQILFNLFLNSESRKVEDPTTRATEDVKIVRDRTSKVVEYMPVGMSLPATKPGQSVSEKKEDLGGESKYNFNNPPSVVDVTHLPGKSLPQSVPQGVFSAPVKPGLFVPAAAQQAVQNTINTVNRIASAKSSFSHTPEQSPDPSDTDETPVRKNLSKVGAGFPSRNVLFPSPASVPNVNPFATSGGGAAAVAGNPFGASQLKTDPFGASEKLSGNRATFEFRQPAEDAGSEEDEDGSEVYGNEF